MLHDDDELDLVEKLQLRIFFFNEDGEEEENLHTFSNVDADIILTDAVIFCYRGIQPKTCNCQPLTETLHFRKAATTTNLLPSNSLILGSWPFSHPPRDQVDVPHERKGIVLTDPMRFNKKDDNPIDNGHSTCSYLEVRSVHEQFCKVQTMSILPMTTPLLGPTTTTTT